MMVTTQVRDLIRKNIIGPKQIHAQDSQYKIVVRGGMKRW
jgi:hypothetical protein